MTIQPRQEYQAMLELMRVETVELSLAELVRIAHTVYGNDRIEVAFENAHPVSPVMTYYR